MKKTCGHGTKFPDSYRQTSTPVTNICARLKWNYIRLTFHNNPNFYLWRWSCYVWGIFHITPVRAIVNELHLGNLNWCIFFVQVSCPNHSFLKLRKRSWIGLATTIIEELQREKEQSLSIPKISTWLTSKLGLQLLVNNVVNQMLLFTLGIIFKLKGMPTTAAQGRSKSILKQHTQDSCTPATSTTSGPLLWSWSEQWPYLTSYHSKWTQNMSEKECFFMLKSKSGCCVPYTRFQCGGTQNNIPVKIGVY